jgi:hypothetical protein
MRSFAIAIVLLLAVKSCGGQAGHVVSLRWIKSSTPNVVYNVYRSPHGTGNFALLNPSGFLGTTFNDTSVAAAVAYDYEVKAESAAGLLSPASNIFSITVPK